MEPKILRLVNYLFSEEESLGDSFSAIWEAHVQQLIPCSLCARTFFPDRIEVRPTQIVKLSS